MQTLSLSITPAQTAAWRKQIFQQLTERTKRELENFRHYEQAVEQVGTLVAMRAFFFFFQQSFIERLLCTSSERNRWMPPSRCPSVSHAEAGIEKGAQGSFVHPEDFSSGPTVFQAHWRPWGPRDDSNLRGWWVGRGGWPGRGTTASSPCWREPRVPRRAVCDCKELAQRASRDPTPGPTLLPPHCPVAEPGPQRLTVKCGGDREVTQSM